MPASPPLHAVEIAEIPEQALEPWRRKPLCANCPFSAIDEDDGQLHCHEDSAKAQAIVGERRLSVALIAGAQPPRNGGLEVLGIVSYFPEVRPNWSCWKHPARQHERRRLESEMF